MAKWWEKGIQFECQGSGRCCVSRGEYGYVYLTLEDRRRFAKYFKITTRAFTKEFCEKEDGIWKLKEFKKSCRFLESKKCSVYEARPTQCRTWPFWPENMTPRAWDKEVRSYCPGVNKGRVWQAKEIQGLIRKQAKSEEKY
ncbi:MAG: YkgJ family cysteine cluster protein [Oligoflexia bacterium]|nr:YkgJ family cysteine cluster protein [Oligoflexia bacterium]